MVTRKQLRRILNEQLKKLKFYDKYTYGLDDVPDKTKAHDDIIGHTWLTHVKRKDSALKEGVGKVLWHSLDEYGDIEVYDIKWSNGRVETNVPAIMLEGVKMTEHGEDEAHGVQEKDTPIKERRYKRWNLQEEDCEKWYYLLSAKRQ